MQKRRKIMNSDHECAVGVATTGAGSEFITYFYFTVHPDDSRFYSCRTDEWLLRSHYSSLGNPFEDGALLNTRNI
jgi:hypothetical protein